MDDNLRIQCRICKGFAPASQFKLHYKYKQVVCPSCASGKSELEEKKKAAQQVEAPKKPAGWDKDDEYLEKMIRMKQNDNSTKIEKIPGTNMVKVGCFKCAYSLRYDPFKKMPKFCPYCNVEVPNLKLYNL
ncbi:MAG: hypothetical protein AABX05_03190 [Nanoarchaeota archaeon]